MNAPATMVGPTPIRVLMRSATRGPEEQAGAPQAEQHPDPARAEVQGPDREEEQAHLTHLQEQVPDDDPTDHRADQPVAGDEAKALPDLPAHALRLTDGPHHRDLPGS